MHLGQGTGTDGLPGVFRGRRDLEPECIDALGAFAAEGPELVGVEGALGLPTSSAKFRNSARSSGRVRTKWFIAHAAMVGLRSAPICSRGPRRRPPASATSSPRSGVNRFGGAA